MSTNNTPSRHSLFTKRLTPYRAVAQWQFHSPDRPPETLYQLSPSIYLPASIVDFVVACHAQIKVVGEDAVFSVAPVPATSSGASADPTRLPLLQANDPTCPTDPLARRMWVYWPNLMTEAEILNSPALRTLSWKKRGFVWSVWTGPDVFDGAFVSYGPDGTTPDIPFDFDRRPFAELTRALTMTDTMSEIVEFFQ